MATENKAIDLVIDANVAFGMLMQFTDVTTVNGKVTETVPVNLTGATFKGSIKTTLDPASASVEDFSVTVTTASEGIALISLTKAQTQHLMSLAVKERDKYNNRIRFVGYYDILISRIPSAGGAAVQFRILEGKIFVSDGVTT